MNNTLSLVSETLCCLCESAVQLVTMVTRWSLVTHVSHVSAMATVSTPMAEISVIVVQASVCPVLGTLRARTVSVVSVDITAPQ